LLGVAAVAAVAVVVLVVTVRGGDSPGGSQVPEATPPPTSNVVTVPPTTAPSTIFGADRPVDAVIVVTPPDVVPVEPDVTARPAGTLARWNRALEPVTFLRTEFAVPFGSPEVPVGVPLTEAGITVNGVDDSTSTVVWRFSFTVDTEAVATAYLARLGQLGYEQVSASAPGIPPVGSYKFVPVSRTGAIWSVVVTSVDVGQFTVAVENDPVRVSVPPAQVAAVLRWAANVPVDKSAVARVQVTVVFDRSADRITSATGDVTLTVPAGRYERFVDRARQGSLPLLGTVSVSRDRDGKLVGTVTPSDPSYATGPDSPVQFTVTAPAGDGETFTVSFAGLPLR
jgi:hypothetical protein